MEINYIEHEFHEAKKMVEECLQEDARCRNDDLWLILQVWQKKQNIKMFVPYDELRNMVSPETLRRVRQQIQNTEGRFLPTDPNIIIRRKMKAELVRKYFSENKFILSEYERIKFGVKNGGKENGIGSY